MTKVEIRHYAIKDTKDDLYISACGLFHWMNVELWTIRRKVTCKRCKKTRVFKG